MKTQKTSWELTVEEDPVTGELILQLPKEFLDVQGWKEGDELDWTNNKDGSWILSKVNNTKS
jgi:bifunctional DNA-binding transcriptional regulator/antitoxin component of YhaV-PrlF toxin-antitoxin module